MRPRVFTSYSHKDDGWKKKFLPHLKALEQAELLDVWVDTRIDAGEKWYPAIQQAMADAAVSVLLISPDYLASDFCIKEEVPYLLNRQEQEGMLLIAVLIHQCPWKDHRWLADCQMLPGNGKCVAIDFKGARANIVFRDVADRIRDFLKGGGASVLTTVKPQRPPLPPGYIDLTRLPETGAALFGRQEELKLLDQAWSSGETPGQAQTRVLAFVAYGGVGKSTLVNHWLREMQRDRFRGATRVFGWSFYSQGAREERMASADTFIDAALRFFGDPKPASGSPWDKGERLARLVGAERTLLVLDGMEPLQSGQALDRGKLRDPALESLLRGLARQSNGLCLVSTREPLPDLAGRPGVAVRDLEQISPEAGRALLRTSRVVGTDADLEALAKRFGPHALTISLLGVFLHERDPHHGIGPAKALEQMHGKEPIDRVLAGFEQWLADTAELEVLRMLGLFDRPADAGCLGALRAKPAIHGLTDRVVKLCKADWDRVLGRLERLRLIHIHHKDSARPVVDAHPLLREHFSQQLCEQHPAAWRSAHRRLYKHLKTRAKNRPRTLPDMEPLLLAAAHGCQAGLHAEAYQLYRKRVSRGGYFLRDDLGALAADLGALSGFFVRPWDRCTPGITASNQARILFHVGLSLRMFGRLAEAHRPLELSKSRFKALRRWGMAADAARHLSQLYLVLGQPGKALAEARKAIEFSKHKVSGFHRMAATAALADVLHQTGNLAQAYAWFQRAEAVQIRSEPSHPLLYRLQGYRYCDLLLSLGRHAEVLRRCRKVQRWAPQQEFRAGYALNQLIWARAAFLEDSRAASLVSARERLDDALDRLRRAGHREFVLRGLLARAELRRVSCQWKAARQSVEDALEIAEHDGMRLYQVDCELEAARLCIAEFEAGGDWGRLSEASAYLKRMGPVLARLGYGRRVVEHGLAAARLDILKGRHPCLAAVKQWILSPKRGGVGFPCHVKELTELEKRAGKIRRR